MNLARTNGASYFLFDGSSSGAAAGGAQGSTGGGTAPPASSPAPASSPGSAGNEGLPAGDVSSGGGADPFEGFDSDSDLDFVDLGAADETGTDPETSVAPVPGAALQAAQPAQAPPEPTSPVVPPAVAAPPPSNEPAAPRSKVESFLSDLGKEENFVALSNWAAENPFRLSEAEAAALDTDAMSVIPKLMGRVYAQALKSAASLIQNFGPEIAQNTYQKQTATATKSKEANDAFYAAHPELNAKDHQQAMERWARAFRAQNPKALREEAIDFVGRAVKLEFGIAAKPAAAQRAVPFSPARPGGRQPVVQQGDDPYSGLDFDFDPQ